MVSYASGAAGKIVASTKGISVSEKGVLVTFFGKNRDGEGDLVRLWEQNRKDTVCTVTLPQGRNYKTAQFCDLRGEEKGEKGRAHQHGHRHRSACGSGMSGSIFPHPYLSGNS